jgi:integrase
MQKLVLLAGYHDGLRSSEILVLTWEYITLTDSGILVNVSHSKTDHAGDGVVKVLPKFEKQAVSPYFHHSLCRDLFSVDYGRLFRRWICGQPTKILMGKTTIANIPRQIATFLGIKDPETYTGHALRVTLVTVLADSETNNLALKRHGRWKSDSIAEEYIRNSDHIQKETALRVAGYSEIISSASNASSLTSISFNNCVFNGPVIMPNKDNKE